jgi:hypothetical protein
MDAQLASYATVRQLEYLEAVEKHGGVVAAARALNVDHAAVSKGLKALRRKAASCGYAPEHDMRRPVPEGFRVKGVSTYYDESGKPKGQWVKSEQNREQQERIVREFVEGMCELVAGKAPTIIPPALSDTDLLAVYPIGDHHHGMYADAKETGANYDSKISSSVLYRAIDHLATIAPAAETALLINLGDFLHANDSSNETPGHHNRLDVDTRYGDVMESAGLSLVRCILRLLEKHRTVHVWMMRGNHDPDAAFALALAIRFFFNAEPRVIVDMGPSLYKYLRFGQNLIGSHHGHGAKAQDLPLIMAHDRAQDWGETQHRVWHCGHIHHKTQKEFVGCVVETHRTLAASDAWHAGKGYRSQRDMNAIIYHRAFGEIQRSRFDLSMGVTDSQ